MDVHSKLLMGGHVPSRRALLVLASTSRDDHRLQDFLTPGGFLCLRQNLASPFGCLSTCFFGMSDWGYILAYVSGSEDMFGHSPDSEKGGAFFWLHFVARASVRCVLAAS